MLHRGDNGKLPAYAWPGGYPIIYIMDDGETLCPDCANGENGSIASETAEPRSGWKIEGADIHWEGEPAICAHCNKEIPSAYGPVETTADQTAESMRGLARDVEE